MINGTLSNCPKCRNIKCTCPMGFGKRDMESEIRGATARGYCHYINEHKVLDPDLLNAITEEVMKVFEAE